MKTNPFARLFRGSGKPGTELFAVTPQRTGERTLLGAENFLGSIAVPEPFSLEVSGDASGVALLARCREGSFVRQQLGVYYPQARVNEVPPEEDPLRLSPGEQAWSMGLRLRGPEYLPLRPFRDDDLLDPGSDPLLSVIGALSDLEPGERLVARLGLMSLGPEWSRAHQEKLYRRQQPDPANSPQNAQAQATRTDVGHLAALGVLALPAIQGYLWVQRGETWKAVLLGLGTAAALAVAGWAWWRIRKAMSGGRLQDPILIKEKLSRIAYQAQLEVIAVLPEHGSEQRAKDLLRNVAAAYAHYNNPAGASFKAARVRQAMPVTEAVAPVAGLFRGRNVLGVREAATLWHPPGPGDRLHTVPRSGSAILPPPSGKVSGGAHVGDTAGGKPRPVLFSPDTNGRHHLYVARTQMGKSTLMRHNVVHKMREKAAGRDGDAIIVVDPHADLVADLLAQVPEEIVDHVYLIDLADKKRIAGINLLDARVFPDRDRTTDSVVRIAHGLWEQWGPRMQSILEHTVKSLHEYNSHPDTPEERQLTILDGQRMLADLPFRREVLKRVEDPYVFNWWAEDLAGWTRETRSQALAPVQTRLGYYSSSKKARAILGQSRSTIDLRKVIREGGVLLVSTDQGAVGRDVSALVGASLLNLVDAVIREQGQLPPEQRRGALVVVDEMQTMPGVDYESMLSELGKFGASFILATQSLARLAELSPTMEDTLLANVGCLAVFQVAASDARQLMGELDRDRVGEEDLVSLPAHQCYVRATHDGQRMPTYTMMVRKPEPGDPEVAERVRQRVTDYTVPAQTVAARDAEAQERVKKHRERMERQDGEAEPGDSGGNGARPSGQNGAGKRDRERNRRRGEETPEAAGAGEGG